MKHTHNYGLFVFNNLYMYIICYSKSTYIHWYTHIHGLLVFLCFNMYVHSFFQCRPFLNLHVYFIVAWWAWNCLKISVTDSYCTNGVSAGSVRPDECLWSQAQEWPSYLFHNYYFSAYVFSYLYWGTDDKSWHLFPASLNCTFLCIGSATVQR